MLGPSSSCMLSDSRRARLARSSTATTVTKRPLPMAPMHTRAHGCHAGPRVMGAPPLMAAPHGRNILGEGEASDAVPGAQPAGPAGGVEVEGDRGDDDEEAWVAQEGGARSMAMTRTGPSGLAAPKQRPAAAKVTSQAQPAFEPEVRLVTRMRAAPPKQEFWNSFMWKARRAWDVFFPAEEVATLAPAHAVKSRLNVLLVSDRCGLDMPTLMSIKSSSMAALAQQGGYDGLAELELQVASIKANGERIQLTLPLSSIPEKRALRDARDYHYDEGFDDDDYFEEDDLVMPDEVDVTV
ncbi:hypothetical protein FOA52_002068 [Chlamydomonas sp. UWO 241]|nr:hypothetical protein FOA52_002068 [Chlamydomonas sp. UWO 241]